MVAAAMVMLYCLTKLCWIRAKISARYDELQPGTCIMYKTPDILGGHLELLSLIGSEKIVQYW